MATQLAIGYLAARRRNSQRPGVSPTSAHVTEHDSISTRPAIPQAVIAWTDADLQDVSLPVGAGDPAAAVDGPPSFQTLKPWREPSGWMRRAVDGALMGGLGVMLIALAVAVAYQLDRPTTTWISRDANPSPLALIGRIPVVEMRVLGFDPLATPAVAQHVPAVTLASKAKGSAAN